MTRISGIIINLGKFTAPYVHRSSESTVDEPHVAIQMHVSES